MGTTPDPGSAGSADNPVDEWGEESFPASDPPTGWKGPEEYALDTRPAAAPAAPPGPTSDTQGDSPTHAPGV